MRCTVSIAYSAKHLMCAVLTAKLNCQVTVMTICVTVPLVEVNHDSAGCVDSHSATIEITCSRGPELRQTRDVGEKKYCQAGRQSQSANMSEHPTLSSLEREAQKE